MNTDEATARLLVDNLDAVRFGHPGYLSWFYRANPRGQAIEANEDDDGNRVGHYAVIPTRYRTPAGPTPFIFSSNVATSPAVRRGGLFRTMAERVYEQARHGRAGNGRRRQRQLDHRRRRAVRVARARSAAGARLCSRSPRLGRSVESRSVDSQLLATSWFDAAVEDLDWVPVADWVQSWTPDFLRWRLSRPDGGYVLHVTPEALAVSVLAHGPLKVRFAVLLKVFPARGRDSRWRPHP